MINVEEYIKQAYHSFTTQRKSRIFLNNQYHDIVNLSYEKDCYDEGSIIGNAIACKIEFDIPSTVKFNDFILEEGIFVNGEYKFIDLGQFTVIDEADKDEFFKHIVAMDLLVNFNALYADDGIYPKTFYGLLKEICQQAQVNLTNTSIVNGDFIVEDNQFVNGESLKFILKQICGLAGAYATIQKNQLVLQLRNTGVEVLNKSDYSALQLKRRTYGINQVVIRMADVDGEYVLLQDDDDIAINGVHKIEIVGNYFAYTQDKREQLIQQLFDQLRGFGYLPYELKGEWLPYLELGDTINIEGTDTILLRIYGKSPNGLDSNMYAPAIIDSAVEFIDNTDTLENRQRRTEIKVDKANGIINLLVQQIEDISQLIRKKHDRNEIHISAEDNFTDYEIQIHGEAKYLYPSSTLYPSTTLYPMGEYLTICVDDYARKTPSTNIKKFKIDVKNYLKRLGNVTDDLVIDRDGNVCVIRRIQMNSSTGEYSLLENEVREDYGKIDVDLLDKYVYIEEFKDLAYTFQYLIKNEFTDTFATQAELTSAITLTTAKIMLEVAKKVDNNVFQSTILQTIDKILSQVSEKYATLTETTEKFASQEITNDSIKNSLSQTTNTANTNRSDLAEMSQTIQGWNYALSSAGGINFIENSTLEGGMGLNHTVTGQASIVKTIDVRDNTISNSAVQLNNGTIRTNPIKIENEKPHTFSCLIFKNELTNAKVNIITDTVETYNLEIEPNKFNLFSATFQTSINYVIIEVVSDNNYILVSDRMLTVGTEVLAWQPFNGEVINDSVHIGRDGIAIDSSDSDTRHVINAVENSIYNKSTGEKQVSFTGELSTFLRTLTKEMSTLGKLRGTVLDNEDVMFTWDD